MIRFEQASFTAQRKSFPSLVGCSVLLVSQSRFTSGVENSRRTRSSYAGRARLPSQTPPLGTQQPEPLLRAQPLQPPLGSDVTGGLQLVRDESVPERRVIGVSVNDSVRQMRVVPVALRDRVGAPLRERFVG